MTVPNDKIENVPRQLVQKEENEVRPLLFLFNIQLGSSALF